LFDGDIPCGKLREVNPIAKKLLRKDSDEDICEKKLQKDRRVATFDNEMLWSHLEGGFTVGVYNGKQLMDSCFA